MSQLLVNTVTGGTESSLQSLLPSALPKDNSIVRQILLSSKNPALLRVSLSLSICTLAACQHIPFLPTTTTSLLCALYFVDNFSFCACAFTLCFVACPVHSGSPRHGKGGWRFFFFKWQEGQRGSHPLEGIGRHINYKSSCQTKLAVVEERISLMVLLTPGTALI